jgi:hypothetical protein
MPFFVEVKTERAGTPTPQCALFDFFFKVQHVGAVHLLLSRDAHLPTLLIVLCPGEDEEKDHGDGKPSETTTEFNLVLDLVDGEEPTMGSSVVIEDAQMDASATPANVIRRAALISTGMVDWRQGAAA